MVPVPGVRAVLKVESLDVAYGEIRALKGVELEVGRGEIVTILGNNGAGKTTTLKTISGLLHPTRGTITLEAEPLVGVPPHAIVSRGVAHVPEGRRIFNRLTVRENLTMGAYLRSDAGIAADLERVFALFPRLAERITQVAGTLSGGEQQMLAIGRALMATPAILLVDEPSVGLAPVLVSRVIAKIRELKERYHLTVLMAEQNFNQAVKIADRGYVIVHGQIAFEGRTKDLTEHELVKKFYLGV